MSKPSRTKTPVLVPAFLLTTALLLSGCSLLSKNKAGDIFQEPESFTIEVDAPKDVRELLEKYLELERYRHFAGLRPSELRRLLGASDGNIRNLLGSIGYFSPTIELELREQPRDSGIPPTVIVKVDPGPATKISRVDISFSGTNADDPKGSFIRRSIERNWDLPVGETFSQSEWSSAKNEGLRSLQNRRYPTAQLLSSSANIDTDTNEAKLKVNYEPGSAYYFGPLVIEGVERYNPAGLIRLARLPVGQVYSQSSLLDAQQRLASSGYYDSVFLTLATEVAKPGEAEVHAPVIAEVREAKLQKWVYGLGFSTDTGTRFSIDHTHNKDPFLNWRAVSKLQLDKKYPEISTRLTSLPDYSGWNYFIGGKAAREKLADYSVNNISLLAGRGKSEDKIDRNYYLQYDMAKPQGNDDLPSSSALTGNYSWTGRYFNSTLNPTRGYGFGIELGAGSTLTPDNEPFGRISARWLYFLPLSRDEETGRRSRLALRANGGAVLARQDATIPVTLLFLAGGDNSIRGYRYQSIGARTDNGALVGGRYMLTGSVAWIRPITVAGNHSDWEQSYFIDAGTVTDNMSDTKIYTGIGTGVLWKSPVGPMQIDVAYGVQTQKIRLHLRLGFNF